MSATEHAIPAIPQVIQMTMTDQEFGIVSLGLSLVYSVRSNDQAMTFQGLALIVSMDAEMREALDSLAEKIDAGWTNIKRVNP